MKIHFLLTIIFILKCYICAKTKYNSYGSWMNLKYPGKKERSKNYRINLMHINNAIPLENIYRKVHNNLKRNIIYNVEYCRNCFINSYYKKTNIVKVRRLNNLWAKKKGVGSTKNGRDSNPKNLGVKILGNNFAHAGNIIVRQRGRTFKPGYGVKQGRDFTLVATKSGKVHFFNRVVSIIDVSTPKQMTYKDIYQENPTIISLSKMWTSAA
ncbi:ribosomal protein L27, putative [Plasmodium chabaudi chabaudi]|uniref:Ribosomal protein L27, putative n=1 Tax=Plasmodium chabaudi chabaudi TaxID=31271 RepID=A0A4V0K3P2_PLACU|nr:ribosomal protein L27, putative [Plasmodium chabaudi chabaudi]VTZ67518.1 ribosomal protein L27, putative [Plasmodium chabaudi chabaudi]|eukprot:XP_737459.2 apicoplast ribosomal protein L27 precursor, putative [Plasmodium chabaudi chabaudi]